MSTDRDPWRRVTSLVGVCVFTITVTLCCVCPYHLGAQTSSRAHSGISKSPDAAQLYSASCAACHGLDGRGGERAPDMATRKEVQRLSDAKLIQILRTGIPGTGMPGFSSLGDAKIRALARYVRTLQGKQPEISVAGNPASGRNLFFGAAGCSRCHVINGVGGFIASDLTTYAQNHSSNEIREAIKHSDQSLGARARITTITSDGKQHEGVIRNEDNFSLQLQSLDGTYHLFMKSEVQKIDKASKSMMPSAYSTQLSSAQVDDVAGFLISLKLRDIPAAKKAEE